MRRGREGVGIGGRGRWRKRLVVWVGRVIGPGGRGGCEQSCEGREARQKTGVDRGWREGMGRMERRGMKIERAGAKAESGWERCERGKLQLGGGEERGERRAECG